MPTDWAAIQHHLAIILRAIGMRGRQESRCGSADGGRWQSTAPCCVSAPAPPRQPAGRRSSQTWRSPCISWAIGPMVPTRLMGWRRCSRRVSAYRAALEVWTEDAGARGVGDDTAQSRARPENPRRADGREAAGVEPLSAALAGYRRLLDVRPRARFSDPLGGESVRARDHPSPSGRAGGRGRRGRGVDRGRGRLSRRAGSANKRFGRSSAISASRYDPSASGPTEPPVLGC